jgi:hypothetical protein
MYYKLYTLVDITHTGQYRNEEGKESLRYKEQNFNTVIHTLGLRSNIWYAHGPVIMEVRGSLIGFSTEDILRVWRFDWRTESENLYLKGEDPVGLLKDDFNLVPYISGLDEQMEQDYAVFVTAPDNSNIVFHLKQ